MSLSIIPAEMSTKQQGTAAANIWHIGFKQMGHHSELQHVYQFCQRYNGLEDIVQLGTAEADDTVMKCNKQDSWAWASFGTFFRDSFSLK